MKSDDIISGMATFTLRLNDDQKRLAEAVRAQMGARSLNEMFLRLLDLHGAPLVVRGTGLSVEDLKRAMAAPPGSITYAGPDVEAAPKFKTRLKGEWKPK